MQNKFTRLDNEKRELPSNIYQRRDGRYQVRFTVKGKQIVAFAWDIDEAKQILTNIKLEAQKKHI